MKLRFAVLSLACLSILATCVAPSASIAYRVGDGKAVLESDGKTFTVGFRGSFPNLRK